MLNKPTMSHFSLSVSADDLPIDSSGEPFALLLVTGQCNQRGHEHRSVECEGVAFAADHFAASQNLLLKTLGSIFVFPSPG